MSKEWRGDRGSMPTAYIPALLLPQPDRLVSALRLAVLSLCDPASPEGRQTNLRTSWSLRLLLCKNWRLKIVVVQSLSCDQLFGDSMDCSLPGSSVHGTFQARVLEWGTTAFSEACLTCAKCKNHCCFSMQGVPVASSKADDLKSSWTFLFSKVSL